MSSDVARKYKGCVNPKMSRITKVQKVIDITLWSLVGWFVVMLILAGIMLIGGLLWI